MRVLFLSHQAEFIYGGERVTLELMAGLQEAGLEVHIAMPAGPYAALAEKVSTVHLIPSVEFRRSFALLPSLVPALVKTDARLQQLVTQYKFDLLHATSLKSFVYAWRLGLQNKIPVLWHHHDILPAKQQNDLWVRWMAKAAKKIAVPSAAAIEPLVRSGIPRAKVVAIHNGLDPARFPLPETKGGAGPLHVIYVGELSERKGVRWLPKLVREWEEKNPGAIHLTIVGEALSDRTLGEELRRELSPWTSSGVVEILGRRENVAELLRKADLLILPSEQDPLPTVVLEAMWSGLPVVARPVGGVPEMVIDGETGFLAEDIHGFAAAVIRLAGDRAGLGKMSRTARWRAEENFSRQKMTEQFLALYRSL